MKQVTFSVPDLPDGFEFSGEYRPPQVGELFLDKQNRVIECSMSYTTCHYMIVVRNRWRAEFGGHYYTAIQESSRDSLHFKVEKMLDNRTSYDQSCYSTGNYFKTKGEATKAKKGIEKLLLESHK